MEVLGVAYRWTPARHAQWQRWADRLGARLTLLYTHPDRADQPTYVGNTHFEFTGYAAAARHAQTDGPYVVVNDTLLDRHASTLWAHWLLVSSSLFNNSVPGPRSSQVTSNEKPTTGVYCDVYPAPRERPAEIPNPYASSWIFYLPTRADLETLSAAVQQVVSQPPAEPSPAYRAFLDRWLNHPVPGVGYQGPRTPEDLARKRQTIMWEHALSQLLVTSNQLQPFKGTRYRILRFIDKVLRRIQLLARPAKQETRNQKPLVTRNQKPMVTRNQQPNP